MKFEPQINVIFLGGIRKIGGKLLPTVVYYIVWSSGKELFLNKLTWKVVKLVVPSSKVHVTFIV